MRFQTRTHIEHPAEPYIHIHISTFAGYKLTLCRFTSFALDGSAKKKLFATWHSNRLCWINMNRSIVACLSIPLVSFCCCPLYSGSIRRIRNACYSARWFSFRIRHVSSKWQTANHHGQSNGSNLHLHHMREEKEIHTISNYAMVSICVFLCWKCMW